MKYCCRCLQPDTRPNTVFGADGVCPACAYSDAVQGVDWQERIDILSDLLEARRARRKPGQFHDCIIGVSGGKDSTRQALWVRDKFGINPLLVCLSYPPEQATERGCRCHSLRPAASRPLASGLAAAAAPVVPWPSG